MSSFPVGSKVILQVKGSQYNGKHGIVKSDYCADSGRQNVLLSNDNDGIEKMVAVKPKNMKLVEQKVMGGGTSDKPKDVASNDSTSKNTRCAACEKVDGELLECACKHCKKLKGIGRIPYIIATMMVYVKNQIRKNTYVSRLFCYHLQIC